MTCLTCNNEVPDHAAFCPTCGVPVNLAATPTLGADAPPPKRERPPSSGTPRPVSGSQGTPRSGPRSGQAGPSGRGVGIGAKFTPGMMLDDRYRIVNLVGRGGMGEVYRADDLKLSQSVALKFLPPALAADEAALARFHSEVRMARQVTHPNVCRMYDIGEYEGQPFLSMEYIDGEDLAALLRRIGRLPPDKALEIARQLCAGVAAAHEAGVLHLDLKPANVMIDGRGRAHITDFGVAGWQEEMVDGAGNPGTPAYMAPEQRLRGEVSVRSDLYSMGLVIYESFTGRRLDPTSSRPTSLVEGLDPGVEKAILRCLARDPESRPASALEVARALPGGDLLAAALAAGETPSPEVVAAAGGEGALERGPAWLLLCGVAVGIAAVLALTPFGTRLGLAPIELTPEELTSRARAVVHKLGYDDPPADTATWFQSNGAFWRHRHEYDVKRPNALPSPVAFRTSRDAEQTFELFRYRQSPQPLQPANPGSLVSFEDPPNSPGMIRMTLDTRGWLLDFLAVPPQVTAAAAPSPAAAADPRVDWSALLGESGLDMHRFQPEKPVWIAPVPFDATAGWVGSYSQDPSAPIHLVAAAFHRKPVYFAVIGPWNQPVQQQAVQSSGGAVLATNTMALCVVIAIVAGILMARRNLRLGRGDPAGAWRIAGFIFVTYFVAVFLIANHVPKISIELDVFLKAIGSVGVTGAVSWLMYMALEPFVRRRWPQLLIGLSRVLAGRFSDPRVGRDLLIGTFTATVSVSWQLIAFGAPGWFQIRSSTPLPPNQLGIGYVRSLWALYWGVLGDSAVRALGCALAIYLSLLLVRKKPAAVILTVIVFAVTTLGGGNWIHDWVTSLTYAAALLFVLSRYGLLACFAHNVAYALLTQFPLTANPSLWYSGRSLVTLLCCLAMAIYGFKLSLGGKPMFGGSLLEDEAS
jgi:hypothetical protein